MEAEPHRSQSGPDVDVEGALVNEDEARAAAAALPHFEEALDLDLADILALSHEGLSSLGLQQSDFLQSDATTVAGTAAQGHAKAGSVQQANELTFQASEKPEHLVVQIVEVERVGATFV